MGRVVENFLSGAVPPTPPSRASRSGSFPDWSLFSPNVPRGTLSEPVLVIPLCSGRYVPRGTYPRFAPGYSVLVPGSVRTTSRLP